ncbi:sensor histidine kinase [Nocardioides marinisabuli]|uniref:sensor histidine kinase n=1 Tax=Nocardioides marinisabuli TaxID=419476 RepID=UPI00321BC8B7
MRARISATVALLVAATLLLAGVLVYAIEARRLGEQTASAVDQELAELSALQEDGVDPTTGEPFADVATLLRLFMERNVPDDDELLVGWVTGQQVEYVSPRTDPLAEDPAFVDLVEPIVEEGGTVRAELPAYGELLVVAQPVAMRSGSQSGALVVVTRLEQTRAGLVETMRTYAIVSALALLVVTGAAYLLTGRLLAPLRTLRETAQEISETDLSRRLPVRGNDDITALTRTVNQMLARLESAFAGQRQFLDDAGHELRTPLTVLRGHLELLDAGDPDDVEQTRALLLDEADRMSRLVGDLILLAKSDRPDFVTPAPCDLRTLTEDVLAKASALGGRDWRLDGVAEVVVPADAQRLTQALLQLAENATKHTGPGDTVALGSAWEGGQVRLWVRDSGPGVAEADRETIFDRFGRGRVPEGDDGFGLGLSIVSAIAEAHGGRVGVEDPGPEHPAGARFVITLPAHPTEESTWPAS